MAHTPISVLVMLIAVAGCGAAQELPPCSSPVDDSVEFLSHGALFPVPGDLHSVAAFEHDGCTSVVFSSEPDACAGRGSCGGRVKTALSIEICGSRVGTFSVPAEAQARYTHSDCSLALFTGPGLGPGVGTIEVIELRPGLWITGTFSLVFSGADRTGTFDALFCGSDVCL